jgi:hypothetical protein
MENVTGGRPIEPLNQPHEIPVRLLEPDDSLPRALQLSIFGAQFAVLGGHGCFDAPIGRRKLSSDMANLEDQELVLHLQAPDVLRR